MTLLVSSVSFEWLAKELIGATSISLTIDRTLSIPATTCPTVALSAAFGISPVISTSRL